MTADLYRVACWGLLPRRYETAAAQLPPADRQTIGWAVLIREDGAQAEVLLPATYSSPVDLSTFPAERILVRRESPHA